MKSKRNPPEEKPQDQEAKAAREKVRAEKAAKAALWSRQFVAGRWGVHVKTIALIPTDQLPVIKFNERLTRYLPADVLAYEESAKVGGK